jgi:hypothetical protein
MNGPIGGLGLKVMEITMKAATLRSWKLYSLAAAVLALSACGDTGSTAPTQPVNLTGTWSMTANNFPFTTNIGQVATAITGSMHSLSSSEPDTPIDGTFNGTAVSFTRHGEAYTQVYTGTVSSDGKTMSGTFSHNGSASTYAWSATR